MTTLSQFLYSDSCNWATIAKIAFFIGAGRMLQARITRASSGHSASLKDRLCNASAANSPTIGYRIRLFPTFRRGRPVYSGLDRITQGKPRVTNLEDSWGRPLEPDDHLSA